MWPRQAVVSLQLLCKLGNVSEAKALCLLETAQQNGEWDNEAYLHFVPSKDPLLLFLCTKIFILWHWTFVSRAWSLQGVWTWTLCIKPCPEAKLCFYWVDKSNHVLLTCQHPASATPPLDHSWIEIGFIECTAPHIPMKSKDNAICCTSLKTAQKSRRQLTENPIVSTILSSSCKLW